MDADVKTAISEELTVPVKVAARALNIGINQGYEAVKSGQLPSIRIGGRLRIPTAPLRKMLGIEAA